MDADVLTEADLAAYTAAVRAQRLLWSSELLVHEH